MRGIFAMNVRTFPILGVSALLFTLAGSEGAEPVAAQTLMSKLKWRCVGPYIGGRVVTVTGVPGNNNLFYAGTVGGGVWKSTDGAEWENITDGKLPGPSTSAQVEAKARARRTRTLWTLMLTSFTLAPSPIWFPSASGSLEQGLKSTELSEPSC